MQKIRLSACVTVHSLPVVGLFEPPTPLQGVIFRENSRNILNDTRYFPWNFLTNDESGYFLWNTEITIAGSNPNPEDKVFLYTSHCVVHFTLWDVVGRLESGLWLKPLAVNTFPCELYGKSWPTLNPKWPTMPPTLNDPWSDAEPEPKSSATTQIRISTRNILDCDQSNYSSRIVFASYLLNLAKPETALFDPPISKIPSYNQTRSKLESDDPPRRYRNLNF